MMEEIKKLVSKNPYKTILSNNKGKGGEFNRVVFCDTGDKIKIEKFTSTQVFHENILKEETEGRIISFFSEGFTQANAWCEGLEIMLKQSKRGKVLYSEIKPKNPPLKCQSHDRKKNYILCDGFVENKSASCDVCGSENRIDNNLGKTTGDDGLCEKKACISGDKKDFINGEMRGCIKGEKKDFENGEMGDYTNGDKDNNFGLRQYEIIEPLVDMGIFTSAGKLASNMQDKFRQINRFIEIINDEVKKFDKTKKIRIIDFGCGKSYLSFLVYYFLSVKLGFDIEMVGLDLKEDVIKKCNETAKKYHYDGLSFEVGDIKDYECRGVIDAVISLHACDTATDYALFNAIKWGARAIFVVPCCQHEINNQIASDEFKLLTKHGIVKERLSSLITDSLRAALLEASGYKTQIMEFVELGHTPKNLLIRGILAGYSNKKKLEAKAEVEKLCQKFNLNPTLKKLLFD